MDVGPLFNRPVVTCRGLLFEYATQPPIIAQNRTVGHDKGRHTGLSLRGSNVMPSKSLPLGPREMMCSRGVNTRLLMATMPARFIVSRRTVTSPAEPVRMWPLNCGQTGKPTQAFETTSVFQTDASRGTFCHISSVNCRVRRGTTVIGHDRSPGSIAGGLRSAARKCIGGGAAFLDTQRKDRAG